MGKCVCITRNKTRSVYCVYREFVAVTCLWNQSVKISVCRGPLSYLGIFFSICRDSRRRATGSERVERGWPTAIYIFIYKYIGTVSLIVGSCQCVYCAHNKHAHIVCVYTRKGTLWKPNIYHRDNCICSTCRQISIGPIRVSWREKKISNIVKHPKHI